MGKIASRLSYYSIRIATFPLAFFPLLWIRFLGKFFGKIAYFCMHRYRKRTLSNLCMARDLKLKPKQAIGIAKQSFENLAITCLEYPKLAAQKNFSRTFCCENPQEALDIYHKGKGVIFFCGHYSNWEILFLDATSRMKGIAIGKPIKNRRLYNWILSIREKNGGKIVLPQNAIKEGLRALKQGHFIGIVGDQGMPASGYEFPFLGRRAWTSNAPALLAYRTNSPIIFVSTNRTKKGYRIRYEKPLWPNLNETPEREIPRLMDTQKP